jgi:hypothetical protein
VATVVGCNNGKGPACEGLDMADDMTTVGVSMPPELKRELDRGVDRADPDAPNNRSARTRELIALGQAVEAVLDDQDWDVPDDRQSAEGLLATRAGRRAVARPPRGMTGPGRPRKAYLAISFADPPRAPRSAGAETNVRLC